MCGRYYFDIEMEELKKIADEIDRNLYGEFRTKEIYPENTAAVMILLNGKVVSIAAKWGIPKWDGKGIIINTRSETAESKPIFKKLIGSGRCIVPASSFFEWRRTAVNGISKEKFKVNRKSSPLFMAGLIGEYSNGNEQLSMFEKTGNDRRYSILTKNADEVVSAVHSRMPVILDREAMFQWFSGCSMDSLLRLAQVNLTAEAIN